MTGKSMMLPESWVIEHVRTGCWRSFHEEEVAGRAVRVALHDHRAIADVREQHGRHVRVVLNQHSLRDRALGPEGFVEVRKAHFALVDEKFGIARGRNRDFSHAPSVATARASVDAVRGE